MKSGSEPLRAWQLVGRISTSSAKSRSSFEVVIVVASTLQVCVCVCVSESPSPSLPVPNLVDISDIFFFLLGEGRGGPRHQEGGGTVFFIEIPGGGHGFQEGEGAGRVSVANRGIILGGGGASNFFFFQGRNVQQAKFVDSPQKM